MKNLKLFPKTFLYTLGIMILIVLVVHLLIYMLLPTFYLGQKKVEVHKRAQSLEASLKGETEQMAVQTARTYALKHNVNIIFAIDEDTYRFQGFTPVGIYFDPLEFSNLNQQPAENPSHSFQTEIKEPQQIIIESSTFKNDSGQLVRLYLMLSIQSIDEVKQVTLKLLPYSILVSILVSLAAAYLYSRRITRPIKNILSVTKQMEVLQKDSFCKAESADEIGMLAANINTLYRTLWNTIHSLERKIDDSSKVEKDKVEFMRTASHELKTPLTSLSILLENMEHNIGKYKDRDLYLKKASELVMHSTTMVQDMLTTSNLQTIFKNGEKEKIDIKEAMLDSLRTYEILAKAKDINIQLKLNETYLYEMNKKSLEKVFSNLLANAIHYTDSKKEIIIRIEHDSISIENECIPLAESELTQIFQGFYRPGFSRNNRDGGSGLGLYIAKEILVHEQLAFTFEPNKIGMKFTIYFPTECC